MNARAALALGLAAAVAGCSGGGGGRSLPALGSAVAPQTGVRASAPVLDLIGVGDSLTAGVQSNGLMGADVRPNPFYTGLAAGSPYPYVQATQTHGFWALLWSAANGVAVDAAATSPLPLIAPPGLGQIFVPQDATGTLTSITTACGGVNTLAYGYDSALGARLNGGTLPADVAIPGQTVHEALYQVAPQTVCGVSPTAGPLGGLATIVNSESLNFYPILGNFPAGTTQVGAAAGLHAKIATVWLGSNDLLKYAFSNGALPPTAPAALATDMVAILRALQASGAHVAVANLIDVLHAAFFIPEPALPAAFTARLTPVLGAANAALAGPRLAAQVSAAYGLGTSGYLTINGLSKVLTAQANGAGLPALGAGDLVSPAIAGNVAQLNAAYNAAIGAAATQTGAALVDVHGALAAAYAAGGVPVSAKCCGFGYGQGFTSLDGIHPSNTGYALIANIFAAAIDSTYGTGIAPVNVATVYASDIYAPH